MKYFSTLIIFFGGLGMFQYGLNHMAESMQKLTGTFIRRCLEVLSDKKIMAIKINPMLIKNSYDYLKILEKCTENSKNNIISKNNPLEV